MTNQELQIAVEKHIKAQKRANTRTLVASILIMVYGVTFMTIMPGINGTILGALISVFGVLIFGFSMAARPNHGPQFK
jgi:hypothetical protein